MAAAILERFEANYERFLEAGEICGLFRRNMTGFLPAEDGK